MKLFDGLLTIVLSTGCLSVYGGACQVVDAGSLIEPVKKKTPMLCSFLSERDQVFIIELEKQFEPKIDGTNDAIVKKIYALKDEFAAPVIPVQPIVDDCVGVCYTLMGRLVGKNYAINQALRALAEILIVSGSLRTAIGYANTLRWRCMGRDDLWSYFIPALLNRYKKQDGHPRGLSCALQFLHRYVEDVKAYPLFVDFGRMQQLLLWVRCWGMAIDNMLQEDAQSFEGSDVQEILEQLKTLMNYANVELYRQCQGAYCDLRADVEIKLQRHKQMLAAGDFSIISAELFANKIDVLSDITKSPENAYNYSKVTMLRHLQCTANCLSIHIPKIFENKALAAVKSNVLYKKLSVVQSDINKQLETLVNQKWTLNIPYGSYFSGLKWYGKYTASPTLAAPC